MTSRQPHHHTVIGAKMRGDTIADPARFVCLPIFSALGISPAPSRCGQACPESGHFRRPNACVRQYRCATALSFDTAL